MRRKISWYTLKGALASSSLRTLSSKAGLITLQTDGYVNLARGVHAWHEKNGNIEPIGHKSRSLTDAECQDDRLQYEYIKSIQGLLLFCRYLEKLGTTISTGQDSVKFILNLTNRKDGLARFRIYLSEFNLTQPTGKTRIAKLQTHFYIFHDSRIYFAAQGRPFAALYKKQLIACPTIKSMWRTPTAALKVLTTSTNELSNGVQWMENEILAEQGHGT